MREVGNWLAKSGFGRFFGEQVDGKVGAKLYGVKVGDKISVKSSTKVADKGGLKNAFALAVLFAFLAILPLQGAQAGGGFVGEGSRSHSLTSVLGALKGSDGAVVRLSGSILRQVGLQKYEFSDGKNRIILKIDDEDWDGLEVSSQDLIEIYGVVDYRFGRANQISVKSIRKLN